MTCVSSTQLSFATRSGSCGASYATCKQARHRQSKPRQARLPRAMSRRMSAVELDRQGIERRDFPIVRRGYDPASVDAHLRALAAGGGEAGGGGGRRGGGGA